MSDHTVLDIDENVSYLHCPEKGKQAQIGPPDDDVAYCPFCGTQLQQEGDNE